ncbi:MAG: hypothetical protein OXT65_06145 [Alphaproteobacteria bacterium]|nr:hypothetical protein [Alphaproteobacteria bacterium]
MAVAPQPKKRKGMPTLVLAFAAIAGLGTCAVGGAAIIGVGAGVKKANEVYDTVEVTCMNPQGGGSLQKEFHNAKVWPTEEFTLITEQDTGREFQAPKHCAIDKKNAPR